MVGGNYILPNVGNGRLLLHMLEISWSTAWSHFIPASRCFSVTIIHGALDVIDI